MIFDFQRWQRIEQNDETLKNWNVNYTGKSKIIEMPFVGIIGGKIGKATWLRISIYPEAHIECK